MAFRAYRIELRRQVQQTLNSISSPDYESVVEKLQELKKMPRPRGVEQVRGSNQILWRVRQGDYRVVYEINDLERVASVVKIGHQREIYRAIQEM